jgi:hypothetical protein
VRTVRFLLALCAAVLLVGYAFSSHWAVEGGFAQLGEFTITRDVTAPAAANARLLEQVDVRA